MGKQKKRPRPAARPLRRSYSRCEVLESRVFPGALLASLLADEADSRAEPLQDPDQLSARSIAVDKVARPPAANLQSLIDSIEHSPHNRPAYRPQLRHRDAAPFTASPARTSSADGLLPGLPRLLDFSLDVGFQFGTDSDASEAPMQLRAPAESGGGGGGGAATGDGPAGNAGGGGGGHRSPGLPRPDFASASPGFPASRTTAPRPPFAATSPVATPQPENPPTTTPPAGQTPTSPPAIPTEPLAAAHSHTVPGDYDGSGSVDGSDFLTWQRNLGRRTGATIAQGDADRDGDVDGYDGSLWRTNFATDASAFAAQATTPAASDFNADGAVDAADGAIWRAHALMTTGAHSVQGDSDADGDVDGADFLTWQRSLGSAQAQATRLLDPAASRDNGDWGYLERGAWQNGTLPEGWQGDYRVQSPGAGDKHAEWVTILPAGEYEVFATWVAAANHAPDAKFHIINGATELGTVVRDQTTAPIDATFGGRSWESLGTYNFTTGVPTVRLTNDASGVLVADGVLFVPKEDCEFDANLTGWRVLEDGGTPTGHGGADAIDCAAVLREGDSFRVSLEQTFVVPAGSTSLSFRYDGLNLDTTDTDFINDAFEVALVDPTGASLVPTYSGDFTRDAFFNVSEGLAPVLGQGATLNNGVVTVSLTGVAAGTHARLVFRLANNDQDTVTNVRIVDVVLPVGTTPIAESSSAKFFVVDATADEVFRYSEAGNDQGDFIASPVVGNARGIASSADGSTLWTIDGATKRVHVQGPDGTSLGSWRALGLLSPEGITVHGNDLWIVDSGLDRVLKFTGGAARRSGEATAASSFALGAGNGSPSDLVTDGTTIWVVDDGADKVFVYGAAGASLGSWTLDAANADASGITLDPTGAVTDLWTVDRVDRRVYRYANARSRTVGSQNSADAFQLATGNVGPEGIADPPPDSIPIEAAWQRGNFAGSIEDAFLIAPNSNQVMMTPVVIDLNGDEIPEVIFSTFERAQAGAGSAPGILRAVRGDTGQEVWSATDPRVEAYGGIAAGDIDLDGEPEIIAHDQSSRVMAFDADGSLKWTSEAIPGGISWGSASIANIDGLGAPEIIIGATVINSDGTIRWSGAAGIGSNVGVGPLSIVADVDLDNRPEIVAGNTIYRADGTILRQFNAPDGFAAIGNFDDDATPEIVLVTGGGVYLFDHDKSDFIWGAFVAGGHGGAPTVADLDADGKPEITVAGANGNSAYNADGSLKWRVGTQDASSNVTGSAVFDLDGDGAAEVLYGDELAFRIYRGTDGHELAKLERGSGTTYELPVVADVNGDGTAEILVVANDYYRGNAAGIYALSSAGVPWERTRSIWNQHSYHITNVNDDGTIPTHELASWELYNNYRRNQQVTGTAIFPPTVSASAPSSSLSAGSSLVLSGKGKANGTLPTGSANQIVSVEVNGRAVDALDVSGNFFASVDVLLGENRYRITAYDSAGQSASTEVLVIGTQVATNAVDFSRYADITGSFSGVYGRTSFNDDTDTMLVELATRNDGTFATDVPLLVGVKNLRERGSQRPTVEVVGADGVTPDGIPYFDFSTFVTNRRLGPGETTGSPVISFHNPNRSLFDYELVFYGKLNTPPAITSVPDVEALTGKAYSYHVTATDEDGDPLAFSLVSGPAGMTMTAAGLITWTPAVSQIGNHTVVAQVADGRGGMAEQRYTVSASVAPPNRPPVITSSPKTVAKVGAVSDDTSTVLDLGTWLPVQIEDNYQPNGNWGLQSNNTVAVQSINADPSMLVGDFQIAGKVIDGAWRTSDTGDDDFMGFVFGYQDERHFYLFDWKRGSQSHRGYAEQGMSVKVVSAESALSGYDLWPTAGSGTRVRTLYHNTIPWQHNVDYNFRLEYRPGEFRVTVSRGDVVLDSFVINDSTYADGRFGFYNYSQGQVRYAGFTQEALAEQTYKYDVEAVDPDDDALVYSLVAKPDGMTIDRRTGLISWGPTPNQVGNHPVKLEVTDGRGGVATQEFVVCVMPDPSNHAPVFVSVPPTSIAARNDKPVGPFSYDATALDIDDDTVTYELVNGPAGMTVNSTSGEVSWDVPTDILSRNAVNLVDGDFVASNWLETSYSSVLPGSVSTELSASGGNPGHFRSITTTVPAASSTSGTSVISINRLTSQVIDPRQLGAILSVSSSQDVKWISGREQTFGLVIFQGGRTYLGPGENIGTSAAWATRATSDLIARDFRYFDTATYTSDRNQNPDFSEAGTPIEFGYYRSIGNGVGSSGFSGVAGLDNWRVTVIPEVTEPVSISANDGRGGRSVQNFVLSVSQASTIQGNIFHDINRDAAWQEGALLLASTASRFNVLLFDGESGSFRYPRFAEPPTPGIGSYAFAQDGTLYSINGKRILRVAVSSNTVEILGEISELQLAGGIAVGPDGMIYVGDEVANNVIRFNPQTGESTGVFAQHSDIRTPRDITFGPDGNLYVLGSLSRTIHRFDGQTGAYLSQFSLRPSDFGNWMTFGPDGRVYVSGLAEDWVKRYDPITGAFIDTFVAAGAGSLDFPGDLVFGPDGNLYVASNATNQILVYDGSSGSFLRSMSAPELRSPARLGFTPKPSTDPEVGLENWTVFIDSNRNGRRDADESFTVTGPGGKYVLDNVASGEHWVVLEGKPGWERTYPAFGTQVVAVTAAESRYRVNFGVAQGTDPTRPTTSPVFSGDTELETVVNEPFVFRPVINDPDGDPLTYSLPSGPVGMTIHPQLGTVVWQPGEPDIGVHSFIVRVRDDRGGIAVQQFSLTVVAPNTAPVFTSSPGPQAVQGRPFVYDLGVLDADGDPVAVTLAAGSVGSLVPTEVRGPNNELLQTRYRFLWTPTAADLTAGSRTVTLAAVDGRGGTTEHTFTLQVVATATNTAPEILSAPRTVAYPGLPFVYPVTAQDIDGNPLTYSLATKPGNMAISPEGVITWTPPGDAAGTHTVRVVVSDGQGGQATQEFTLRIASQSENTAPQITSNPPQSGQHEKPYLYNAAAVDAEGDPLVWSLDAAPIGMSVDPVTGAIRWVPREDQIGPHSVTLRASDPFGVSAVQSFVIEVACVNTPPLILSTPPTQAAVGETYFYGVRAVDPDGDPLTFLLSSGPATMSISPSGLIRWTPDAVDQGQTRTVIVRVQDNDGGFALQEYRIEVTAATNLNRAPVITSTPNFSVTLGDLYEYVAAATDADGDTLTYSLPVKPSWLNIDPATGRLFGTPPTTGVDAVVLQVSDGKAVATQGFAINVRANSTPTINSTALTTATVGGNYRYSVRATDVDGDPLTYTVAGPAGMTIDGLGRILWSVPVDAAVGGPANFPVSVSVSDPRGASATQNFTIVVSPDTQAPTVTVQVQVGDAFVSPNDSIDLGATATIRVTAFDNVGVTSLALEVDGRAVALDAEGRATISAASLGPIVLIAKARDLAGNEGTSTRLVRVIDPADRNRPVDPNRTDTPVINDPTLPPHPGFAPGDNMAPTVVITKPLLDATVTNLTPIFATIDDPENHLWYWRVYTARLDQVNLDQLDLNNPNLKQIAQGTNEVVNDKVATFDPTLLTNDPYAILVAAFDVNGQGFIAATTVNVEGNVKLGEFRLELTDLTIPLAGIPIQVSRVYDSREAGVQGDFGYGWTLGVQSGRILETVPPGPGPGLFSEAMPFVPGKTKVYITNPSGQRVGFTYNEELINGGIFGANYRPVFKPDPGVYDTLEAPGTITRGLLGFIDYNPDEYTLTTKEGLKYRYSQSSGLQSITDRNANVVNFTRDGIVHESSGVKIDFVRDARGRITQLVAPDGTKVLYDYNAAGELVKVTTQSGTTSQYTYFNRPAHYLDEGFDARGERAFKVTYDDQGRYVAIIDALGNAIQQQNYDQLADRRATVRDANGNATQLLYDERGNVIEETDAAGNVTKREYGDPRNPDLETKVIDREGMVTERAYDARGNVTRVIELGHKDSPLATPLETAFAYNGRNDVTSITNANGSSTIFDYDSNGNLTKITNAAGNSSLFTYDGQGRRIALTDFNGNTTRFEYNAPDCGCANPRKIIAPDGTWQAFEYNSLGQPTLEQRFEADGTLVEQKRTVYDASGRVTREITGVAGADPLHGQVEVRKFYSGDLLDWEIIVNPLSLNPDGSLKESPATPVNQRQSRITDFDYDASGKLVTQTDAEGGVVRFRYDAQGNRVLLQDPVGNITTWTYDALNRVAEERDPFYWVDFVTANTALPTEALLSAVVERNKLASGANVDANVGAPHVRVFGYDGEGQQSKVIDRNGRRREFEYDQSGRLTEERWYASGSGTLVETISFAYDGVGNMVLADDSNSHYVFTYDSLNRLRTVNNADGVVETPDVLLTYEYDAQGNVTKTFDDAGVTVESVYSDRNLLQSRKWYDELVPAGADADVSDVRIDFTYNAAGREIGIARYSDLSATRSVGHTNTTRDLSGRVDRLTHVDAVDALLSKFDYGYDFGGLVVTELRDNRDNQFDQSIDYVYDLSGQLTDALFDTQEDEHYEYDHNGNRTLARVGSTTRTYGVPAPSNQLVSDGKFSYAYDEEGNQVEIKEIATGATTLLAYDHLNRLVRVDKWTTDPRIHQADALLSSSSVDTYDALGKRISAATDEDGEGPLAVSKRFSTFDGEHLWREFSVQSGDDRAYLYGSSMDQLLATWTEQSGASWIGSDQIGSVVCVVDVGTGLASTIPYSAYGVPLSPDVSGTSAQILFAGREYDSTTGIYNSRARSYDANNGRFLQRDPMVFQARDANLYRYGFNSPTAFTDPTGTINITGFAFTVGRLVGTLTGALSRIGFSVAARFFSTAVTPALNTLARILQTQGVEAALRSPVLAYLRGALAGLLRGSASNVAFRETVIAALRGTAQSVGGRELVQLIVRGIGVG